MNEQSKKLEALGFSIYVKKSEAIIDHEWGGGDTPVIRSTVQLYFGGSYLNHQVMETDYTQGLGHHPKLHALRYKEVGDSIELMEDNLKWCHKRTVIYEEDTKKGEALLKNWGKRYKDAQPTGSMTGEQLHIIERENRKARREFWMKKKMAVENLFLLYYKSYPTGDITGVGMSLSVKAKQDLTGLLKLMPTRKANNTARIEELTKKISDAKRETEEGNQRVIEALTEPVAIELADFLHSILLDAPEQEYWDDFEGWANELGYDTDSRKAEGIWKSCCDTGKSLEAMVSEESLAAAREIVQDY